MDISRGLRELAPYAMGFVSFALVASAGIFVCRRRLRVLFTSLSPEGAPLDGAARFAVLLASALLWWLGSIEFFAAAGLLAGIPVGAWSVGAAVVSAGVFLWFASGDMTASAHGLSFGLVAAAAIATVIFATVASGHFFDVSWDGNTAHQVAVVELAHGWNPMRRPQVDHVRIAQWLAIENFPKGAWTRAAALYRLTGLLEQAKLSGLVLLGASCFAWTALLVALAKKRRAATIALFAIVAAANPVALAQAFTFMVDGQVASLFSLSVAFSGLLFTRFGRWPVAAALSASLLMLSTAKFTGLVYAVALAVGLLVACTWSRPSMRRGIVAAWVGGTLVVAVCFVGFNPYAANLLHNRSIFYPLVGSASVDIMSNNVPGDFIGKNGFERLFRSLFSRAAHQTGESANAVSTRLKVPFSVAASEIRPYLAPETRVAGFGPWFGGILLLTGIGVVVLLFRRQTRSDRGVVGLLCAATVVVATVLVNPEGWWARYAPQLWLVPVLVSFALAVRSDCRPVRALGWTMCALLFLNTAFVGVIGFGNTVNARAEVGTALDAIASVPGGVRLQQRQFETTWAKLDARGIAYHIVSDEPTLTGGVTIPYTTAVAVPVASAGHP